MAYVFKDLQNLLWGIVKAAVVGADRCVVATAGGFGVGVAEVHHSDFAFSRSSSYEVVA